MITDDAQAYGNHLTTFSLVRFIYKKKINNKYDYTRNADGEAYHFLPRLKEQRDRSEKEHQDELDLYTKKAQDLKVNLDKLQKELTSKQTEVRNILSHCQCCLYD